jgi:hypothetical protein
LRGEGKIKEPRERESEGERERERGTEMTSKSSKKLYFAPILAWLFVSAERSEG